MRYSYSKSMREYICTYMAPRYGCWWCVCVCTVNATQCVKCFSIHTKHIRVYSQQSHLVTLFYILSAHMCHPRFPPSFHAQT